MDISFCQIFDNESLFSGGGVLVYNCTPNMVNNTIVQNRCTSTTITTRGGGLSYYTGGSYTGENNILLDNIASTYPDLSGTASFNYSCSPVNFGGTGNIDEDPMFANPIENDFSLLWGSPCIDTGNPASPLDPDGSYADMGALYFQHAPGFEFCPQAPSDFLVNHNNEQLIASLAWVNPSLNISGDPLGELSGVKIYRDDVMIDDVTDVTIGVAYSYDDNTITAPAMYEYKVVPYNSYGDGMYAESSAWIGIDTPGEAQSPVATPHWGYELRCYLNWAEPVEGAHGGYYPVGSFTGQKIYRNSQEIAVLTGSNNWYTDESVPGEGFYSYSMLYYNDAGDGTMVIFDPSPVYVGSPQYEEIPYDWVEISSIGTNSGITNDDQIVGPFPMGFNFPFFNSETYNRLWICSNGWVTFTQTSTTAYTNAAIPNTAAPNNIICPYWDDFNPSTNGDIYYYYDETNDRFIIEWYQVAQYSVGGSYTFEIILYEDGKIDFMYNALTGGTPESATVGCEDAGGTEGYQVTYNGSGPLNPHDSMGIRLWVGAEPPLETSDPSIEVSPQEFSLHPAYPNPFNPATTVGFTIPSAGKVSLVVYDIAGREVARLVEGWRQAGQHQVTFSAEGLASGIYFYRLQAGNHTANGKMVLMK